VIFIDEFQAIFTSRRGYDGYSVGSSLCATLAGCFDDMAIWNENSGPEFLVVIIAATNEPWSIDKTFLRSDRLEKTIYIGEVSLSSISAFFTHIIGIDIESVHAKELIESFSRSGNFTGAEIKYLIRKSIIELLAEGEDGALTTERITNRCKRLIIEMTLETPRLLAKNRFFAYEEWEQNSISLSHY